MQGKCSVNCATCTASKVVILGVDKESQKHKNAYMSIISFSIWRLPLAIGLHGCSGLDMLCPPIWSLKDVKGLVPTWSQDFEKWAKLEVVGKVWLQEVLQVLCLWKISCPWHLPVCLSLHFLATMSWPPSAVYSFCHGILPYWTKAIDSVNHGLKTLNLGPETNLSSQVFVSMTKPQWFKASNLLLFNTVFSSMG